EKLHESIWATRLSGGTGMSLNWIDVTAVGEVVVEKERITLKVKGSEQLFVLKQAGKDRKAFARLREAPERGQTSVMVTRRLEEWTGPFAPFLKAAPKKPWAITVKEFEAVRVEAPPKP